MTIVVTTDVLGRPRAEPARLPARRRRLAGVVKRHAPAGRPYLVSVHRRGTTAYNITDDTVRLRRQWSETLLGPHDVVVFTTLPRGGAVGGGGGGGKAGIGLAVASIALIALAPYLAPLLLGAQTAAATAFTVGTASVTYGTLLKVGLVIGGLALGMAAQGSAANKKTEEGQARSIAGGGNLPRPGERKPLIYGRCWTQPPLSQQDVTWYSGDEMILVKRITLGLGKFQVHSIKVGTAEMWNETDGIVPPFTRPLPQKIGLGGAIGGVNPVSDVNNTKSAVEILYEAPSTLMAGDVITSQDVSGQSLPRSTVAGDPVFSPWYRVAPLGQTVNKIHLDFQWPAGLGARKSSGERIPNFGRVEFFAQKIDNLGNPVGSEFELLDLRVGPIDTTKPVRRTVIQDVEESNYRVRGRNHLPAAEFASTEATWDGLRGHKTDTRIRQKTTEIVMRVRTGLGLSITSMSDVWVEATRIIPVWNGSAWVEQPEQRAIWAYADLVRASYGLDEPGGFDVAKAYADRNRLAPFDGFNGVIQGSPSFWEAASEILLPIRADPVKVGAVHSYVRDEAQVAPRHVVSRRQIVKDSSSATYKLSDGEGIGHVIVEYDRDGDPQTPDRAEWVVGSPSRTPQRLKVKGIRTAEHAQNIARWKAATGLYRGAERSVEMEWDGRLIYPGDQILCDSWYLGETLAAGVASRSSNALTMDADVNIVPNAYATYCSIRTRAGREWGILRCQGFGARGVLLHPSDVAGAEAATGITLANAIAKETQDPTTVVFGTLQVLQKTYVARAAIPTSPNQVRIEMVRDDPRVWEVLDEPYTPPTPAPPQYQDPLIPTINVLTARSVRVEAGIELAWSILPAPGAKAYQVELASDGVSFEPIYAGSETSGSRAMSHNADLTWTVRARAIGRTDIPGEWIETTFKTISPEMPTAQFDSAKVWNFTDGIEDFTAANASLSVVDGWLRVTPSGSNQHILSPTGLAIDGARYPIVQARIRRVAGEGDWDGTVRYSTGGHAISDSYRKALPDPNVGIGESATLIWDMRDLDVGGSDWAASIIDRIRLDLGTGTASTWEVDWLAIGRLGPASMSANLTEINEAIEGFGVRWGVQGEVNGVTGKFVFQGIEQLDGSVAYGVEIEGDLMVTGSITGGKLVDLTVNTDKVTGGAITGHAHADGVGTNSGGMRVLDAPLTVRAGSTVEVKLQIDGSFTGGVPSGTASYPFYLYVDGVLTKTVTVQSVVSSQPDGESFTYTTTIAPQTILAVVTGLSAGAHTFSAVTPLGDNRRRIITATEFAK